MKNLRNIIMFSIGIFAACLFFPETGYAQYNPTYNGGTYINQMIRDRMNARRMAARMANRRNTVKKKVVRKKAVRTKSRRVSLLPEKMIFPKFNIDVDLPKRSSILS